MYIGPYCNGRERYRLESTLEAGYTGYCLLESTRLTSCVRNRAARGVWGRKAIFESKILHPISEIAPRRCDMSVYRNASHRRVSHIGREKAAASRRTYCFRPIFLYGVLA